MNKRAASLTRFVVLMVFVVLVVPAAALWGAPPEPAVQKLFGKLLAAIQANDRAAFLADATDEAKKGLTPQVMDDLNAQLGPRLKKGFKATYLCQLKQQGLQVHLWKMNFKDGGDEAVVRIALKDGKLAGFFIQ